MKKDNETKRIEVERMKELMGEMSQQAFSEKTGISQSSISKILSNQHQLSANNIMLLAKSFNVSADWIIGLTNDRDPKPITHKAALSYGDIFEVVATLIKERSFNGSYGTIFTKTGPFPTNEIETLTVQDAILQSIFAECCKMQSVPQDVYDAWYNKRKDEYSDITYIQCDLPIQSAFNHYFGGSAVNPQTLKSFFEEIPNIFKEILEERDS